MKGQIIQLFVSLVLILMILAIIFFLIFKGGNISNKQLWHILLVFFIAIVVVLNLRPHWSVEKKYRKFFESFFQQTDEQLQERLFGEIDSTLVEDKYIPFTKVVGSPLGMRVSGNNKVEIITEGAVKYEMLLHDLENAKESINVEYFHFGADKGSRDVRNMLIKKAQEGVKVKFINENVANFPIGHRYYRSMKKAGVEVIRFTSIQHFLSDFLTKINYRNHRKIVVIDGKIAYTGGMNINDHYFRQWRDTHLRIEGDAVASLQLIFLNSWVISDGKMDGTFEEYFPEAQPCDEMHPMQVVADEPGMRWHPIQMGYEWALLNAKDYFYAQTPYFVPTEPVLDALKAAAIAGVDVRIMLPKKADTFFMGPANKSFYRDCLLAGVKIYEREEPFIHAKTFVSDDYLSCIGTANMDIRSFKLDYEDNVYMYDKGLALENKEIFFRDLEVSREITLDEVDSWHWYQRFLQKMMRLFAPLL